MAVFFVSSLGLAYYQLQDLHCVNPESTRGRGPAPRPVRPRHRPKHADPSDDAWVRPDGYGDAASYYY